LLLIGIGGAFYFVNTPPDSAGYTGRKVLAIAPLRPANGGEDEDGLGYGIAENLAARLGGLDGLDVKPVSAHSGSVGPAVNIVEFGKISNATVVLAGSFQRMGGRLRMTVNLTDVARGAQIWSGNFDEDEEDIFKLQDSLCALAAEQLIKRLTLQQTRQLAANPTDNIQAYKLYLKGRYLWNKRTKESIEESIGYLRSSIDADPAFSLAYAGLADSYVILNDYDAAPPSDTYPKAKAAAMKALEIDPGIVQPRITLAYILAVYDWDYRSAENEYRAAIERNPNYATAHQWYGEMLCATKRFAEAEVEFRRAAEIDPLVPIIQSEIAVNMYYSRRYDDAIAQYSKLKEEHPAFPTSYLFSAWAYEQLGETERSFNEEIQFWTLQDLGESTINELRSAFKAGGRTAFLEHLAQTLEKSAAERYFHEYRIIHVYGRLRNRGKVLEWLEKGVRNRSSNVVKVFIDPNFDFLRGDLQFQQLLDEMVPPS
jgi:TolB-like protein